MSATQSNSNELRDRKPRFTSAEVLSFSQDLFGLGETATALPSERDQNFHLQDKKKGSFVLKISQWGEDLQVLDLQLQVLEHLAKNASELGVPELQESKSGKFLEQIEDSTGRAYSLRVVSYLEGTPLAKVRPHSAGLLKNLGNTLGRLDRSLQEIQHPAARRPLQWNLLQGCEVLADHLNAVRTKEEQDLLASFLRRFQKDFLPHADQLRRGLIHHDANDYNVLVKETLDRQAVAGIIDFGDMVHSYVLAEIAVGAAYIMLEKRAPMTAAARLVQGYHQVYPIPEEELFALFPLICMRLCTSVAIAAFQRQQEPNNEYLSISERPAWDMLRRLKNVHPNLATATFRQACGLEPCPNNTGVRTWLKHNQSRFADITNAALQNSSIKVVDMSVGNLETPTESAPRPAMGYLAAQLQSDVGLGRYNEARLVYTSDLFADQTEDRAEPRTVHLGMDLFLPAGSVVAAPLEGIVHSFHCNDADLDYGPTVILEHEPDDGIKFFTLYGHLSRASLNGLQKGQNIGKGEIFAQLGCSDENGGWLPHLHFQLITDMLDHQGDYPGVAAPSRASLWRSFCPDPNLVLGLRSLEVMANAPSRRDLSNKRQNLLGPSLSLSYASPLHIVRGRGQYLYDREGRRYLDAVNNVPHVGHCHPHVVQAGQRQMAVLNTNTRYLHENILQYAERLTALFPSPLDVCYLVCSGSEANELAVRLARCYTGAQDILVLEGGYHGNTSTLVDLSSYKFDGPGGFSPPPWVHKAPLPDPYRGRHRGHSATTGRLYAQEVTSLLQELLQSNGRLAAFLAEPFLGCGGQIIPPPDYFKDVYASVRKAGGLCIADEVQVGFGRAGTHMWAFETHDVVPDIVTLGKPIGNGHPLAAVITTAEVARAFHNGMEYFNTYGGNPVSCAIGAAVLDVLEDEGLQQNARKVGDYLLERFREMQTKHPLIGEARGAGLYLGIELVLDPETKKAAPEHAAYVVERMKEKGILISTDGPLHNVLKIKPPMVFHENNARQLCQALSEILQETGLRNGPKPAP